jgi:hypothetical protein
VLALPEGGVSVWRGQHSALVCQIAQRVLIVRRLVYVPLIVAVEGLFVCHAVLSAQDNNIMKLRRRLNLSFAFLMFALLTEALLVSEAWSYCTVIDSPQNAGSSGCSGGNWYARNTCSQSVTANIEKCNLINIANRTCSVNAIDLAPKQETYLGCGSLTDGVSVSYRVVGEK